ncbi:MAG: hypothetical protein EOP06_18690 [Proteobacteria bacterium]|nr:MAG: hypothetical protein EOP06_18690 [Pseudomonadota bacterium]
MIPSTWFNDNASRNFKEFVREGQNVFDKILFKGEALTLYAPEPSVLALSKISPMLDRERIDTQDIIGLIEGGFLSRIDFDSALSQFEFSIRYEVDPHFRKKSWELSKLLKTLSKDWFGD